MLVPPFGRVDEDLDTALPLVLAVRQTDVAVLLGQRRLRRGQDRACGGRRQRALQRHGLAPRRTVRAVVARVVRGTAKKVMPPVDKAGEKVGNSPEGGGAAC